MGQTIKVDHGFMGQFGGIVIKKMNVLNSKGEEDMKLTYLPDDFSINSAKVTLFNPRIQGSLKRSRKKRVLQARFLQI